MQHALLETVQSSGGFLAQFNSIEDLKEGLVEAITATEINAILAAQEDFDGFASTQFPNIAGATQFVHSDVHVHFNQITTFHKMMDDLETAWEENNA